MRNGILLIYMAAALCAGCALEPDLEPEPAGDRVWSSRDQSLASENRLTLNRLTLNRLTVNRLSTHRLSGTELAFNSADNSGMEGTAENRELLEYMVRCALPAGISLVIPDAGGERGERGERGELAGDLGLAPQWEQRPLLDSEQELISACLLAHVNAFGAVVPLSVRAAGRLHVGRRELSQYSVYEGTFFGQLFGGPGTPMRMYSCQGDSSSLARVHSAARELRVCTDETAACEIQAVGRCRDVCRTYDPRHGWRQCTVRRPGGAVEHYRETVSAFLFADNPDGANRSCPGDATCRFFAPGGQAALFSCDKDSECSLTCGEDGMCTIRQAAARHVQVTAERGATVEADCKHAGTCALDCAPQAQCEVDCRGAGTCTAMHCAAGAECLLHCTGAAPGACGFASCAGPVTSCPGGVLACGRGCP